MTVRNCIAINTLINKNETIKVENLNIQLNKNTKKYKKIN